MNLRYVFTLIWIFAFHIIYAQQSTDKILEQGFQKYENGDCNGAIEEYTKAIQANKKNSEAYYLRGVCKSMQEKNLEAIEDFDLAIKYNPQYPEAYFEKAYSYYALDKDKEAIALYTIAIELDPEYAEAFMNRGSVKHNLNDMKGACEDWAMAESLGMNIVYSLLKEYCMD